MARSMRIEFPGAVYHVTSRGDRREAIFDDDQDAQRFLAVLGQATDRGVVPTTSNTGRIYPGEVSR
jgi:hypothetical protein